jgi:hypothetical protein
MDRLQASLQRPRESRRGAEAPPQEVLRALVVSLTEDLVKTEAHFVSYPFLIVEARNIWGAAS